MYAFCKRQLWYYAHYIRPQAENKHIQMGSLAHETSFQRATHKNIHLLNEGVIDWIDPKTRILHENKTGKVSHTEGDILQLKYYLNWLHSHGISVVEGHLHYIDSRDIIHIPWTETIRQEINTCTSEIQGIIAAPTPHTPLHLKKCNGCSYFSHCYNNLEL